MGGSSHPLTLAKQSEIPDSVPHSHPVWSEQLSAAVLQFSDRTVLEALTQPPIQSELILTTMRQFIELVKKLRSPEQGWHLQHPPTPETLLPYVKDDADDLLETLQAEWQRSPTATVAPVTELVQMENLYSKLLWCVARSSYPIMQLLEGIPAQMCGPEGQWEQGILRLAVIVEVATADESAAIDLALGSPPHPPLHPDSRFQVDPESVFQAEWDTLFTDDHHTERSIHSLKQSFNAFTPQLVMAQPVLQAWVEGIAVNWLTPESNWQTGILRLILEVDFIPRVPHPSGIDAVEAEFLDDRDPPAPSTPTPLDPVVMPPMMPITIVDMPLSPAIATTIVRLATPTQQEQFTQLAVQQALSQSINALQAKAISSAIDPLLLPLMQESCRLADLTTDFASTNFCLLQPELFLDELLPKLLWHVTRSSFKGMEWLGGVACNLLRPSASWQTGTLRLVVVLNLQTQDEQWWIDLATGRFLAEQQWQIPAGAIAQLPLAQPANLLPVDQLQAQLEASIYAAAPEIASLSQGVEVEWLTLDHDWQPGHLRLHTGWEFIPDLF